MIRKSSFAWAILCASLLACSWVAAQVSGPTPGVSTNCGASGIDANGNCLTGVGSSGSSTGTATAAASFSGPGDVVSGWTMWGGLRAFSAATAGTNAADVFCVTATTTQTIKTLANGNFDVATLTTACPADTYHVSKLYDQTGNGRDFVQAVDGNRPVLTLNCLNTSLPCLTFSSTQQLKNAGCTTQAQPFTFVAAVIRTAAFTTQQVFVGCHPATNIALFFATSTNTVSLFAGSTLSATAADSTWHAFQAVVNAGSSNMAVNGSSNIGTAGVATLSGANGIALGQDGSGGSGLQGRMVEAGITTSGFSAALATNMQTYWSF